MLCIDANSRLLALCRAPVESYGYHVDIVSSGDAAVEMLKEAPVAAILLEYKADRTYKIAA